MLEKVNRAFDEAWASIADGFDGDQSLIDSLRESLARIILNCPADELDDLAQVKATSLQILALNYPGSADLILHRPPAGPVS